MQQTIDIELLKKEPAFFFSQLSEDAEKEFINLLEYFIYKYHIKVDYKKKTEKKKVGGILKELSNPSLINQENDIWEQVIKEKHENR